MMETLQWPMLIFIGYSGDDKENKFVPLGCKSWGTENTPYELMTFTTDGMFITTFQLFNN